MDFSSGLAADQLLESLCANFPATACAAELGQLTPAQEKRDFDALSVPERKIIEHAVERRKGEFSAARRLAHKTLTKLGYPQFSLLRDTNGAPCWPTDVVGSITHCDGFRAAVASKELTAVGIDAEPARPLPIGVLETIAGKNERKQITESAFAIPMDTVLFSVKETIYKCWYPVAGTWLGFEDARVNFKINEIVSETPGYRARGTFSASVNPAKISENRVLQPLVEQFSQLSGQWFIISGLVIALCVVP